MALFIRLEELRKWHLGLCAKQLKNSAQAQMRERERERERSYCLPRNSSKQEPLYLATTTTTATFGNQMAQA